MEHNLKFPNINLLFCFEINMSIAFLSIPQEILTEITRKKIGTPCGVDQTSFGRRWGS